MFTQSHTHSSYNILCANFTLNFMLPTGVALAGEVGPLRQHQILGVHRRYLQMLMVLLSHQIILVAVLHQEVDLVGHQQLEVIDTILLLLRGARILGHCQLQGC